MDDALFDLDQRLSCVVGAEMCKVQDADGRIVSGEVRAIRSHPPTPNSAVDGYGFAGGLDAGVHQFKLVDGRAAAGEAYGEVVPTGHAIRILTGAPLPIGVDTVVLQEDVTIDAGCLHLRGPLKQGSNARAAGEDMVAGQVIFGDGHQLKPQDLGVMAAAGLGQVRVKKRLTVAVFSTGTEVLHPGQAGDDAQIYDANRPMLIAVLRRWGYRVLDLGIITDSADAVETALDAGAKADAIITSGGASGGDEDHMSRVLNAKGAMALWRIAIKPGRPLALGMWHNTPVFGLPGNPVAAFVCTLLFARSALAKLAGAAFDKPIAFQMPANFEKRKKPGRREFLRARIVDGQVERFASEGSGRISGLSWADGLVELPDGEFTVEKGDLVSFIPFAHFGL